MERIAPWWFESTRAHAKSPAMRGFFASWRAVGVIRAVWTYYCSRGNIRTLFRTFWQRPLERTMSVQRDRGALGGPLARRHPAASARGASRSEEAAREFDEALREVAPAERRAGCAPRPARRRLLLPDREPARGGASSSRRSDGAQTTKRGFPSEKAARDARRRLIEQIERGEVRHTKETFGGFWDAVAGAAQALPGAGHVAGLRDRRSQAAAARARADPARRARRRARSARWMDELAEAVEAGELAPKTVNNTLGTLVVCLNAAVEDGLIASNPGAAGRATSARRTSSASTCACTRSRSTSTRARTSTGRSPSC